MNKGILIVLLVALLPLVVFAQEDVDPTYLSDDLQDKLGIKDSLTDDAEDVEVLQEELEDDSESQSEAEPLINKIKLAIAEHENPVIETPELVPAGSARDSPFYSLDRFLEKMRLRITGNAVAKTQLQLKFAEERLAEAKKLIELNKQELAEETIDDYKVALQDLELDLGTAKDAGNDVESTVQELSEMTVKHLIVLRKVLENVPDTAKPAIMSAIEISKTGQENAIMNLAQIRIDKELKTVEVLEAQSAEAQSEDESSSEPSAEELVEEETTEEAEEIVEEEVTEPVEAEVIEEAQSEDESSDEPSSEGATEVAEEPVEEEQPIEDVEEETETSKGKGWH